MDQNRPIANFIVRWISGLLFLMAGYWKVFVLTPIFSASDDQGFDLTRPKSRHIE